VTAPAPKATRKEWIGLVVLALPCILYSMDLTVLYLAIPELSRDLEPSASQLLWIMDIYGFLVAGFLVTMGTLGDRIGRRKLLFIGAAAFGVASVLAAFSRSAETLIAARAVLGIAGATLAPSTLSLIRNMFLDDKQRTFAIGVWIASFSLGGAIAPLVGGLMITWFWWGSVFLLAVPVMILLLGVGPFLLTEYKDPNAGRLDILSAIMSLLAVLGVIYGVKLVAEHGVGWAAIASIAAGIAVGAAFVARQRRLADPLIDVRLFRVPAFTASLGSMALCVFTAFGAFLFMSQYLQLVLGLSPLVAGLWTAPTGLVMVVGSMVAPAVIGRFKPAHVLAGGFLVSAVGLVILTQIAAGGLPALMVGILLVCVGCAPIGTLATDLVVGSAPPERAGAASAMSETGAELGGALGIAVLGSVATAVYRARMSDAPFPGVPPEAVEAARATLGGATTEAAALSAPLGQALVEAARGAFVSGFALAAGLAAVVALATAVIVLIVLRKPAAPGAAKAQEPAEKGPSPVGSEAA
jgi:DHA2 family multidrug resistance protein-like MFS transporter